MANVRFFRLSNLPDFSPVYKGIFVYVPEMRTLGANDSVIMGWPNTFPVPATLSGNVPGTSTPWSQAAAITTGFNRTELDSLDFRRFYDETNGGHYVTVGVPTKRTTDEIVEKGLWFGGEYGWELLTNYGSNDGITWDDLFDWFNGTNSDGYIVAGEAEIFEANDIHESNPDNGQYGTEYTIYDPVLDMNDGLHASTDASDAHSFIVGDGALKFKGKELAIDTTTDPQNHAFTDVPAFDVHSANDTENNTVVFDQSLYIKTDDTGDTDAPFVAKIGVRTATPVGPNNFIVTQADVTGLSGSMQLMGTIANQSELPGPYADDTTNPETPWHDGDTLIVTNWFKVDSTNPNPTNLPANWQTAHDGEVFEIGDTLVYFNDFWHHIQGNLTVGVDQGFIPKVSDAQGSPAEGLALDTNNNEKHKLVATDGTGVYKTDIAVDFLDNLLVGLPEIDVHETDEGQDTAALAVGQDLCHEIELTHTYQIGTDSSDVYAHSLIINTPNKSIDIQVPTNTSDNPETITVDLVWRETLD